MWDMEISYGANVADDGELRLCGDLNGKRAIELGVSSPANAVVMALQGAKAIAVDSDPKAITGLRAAAERAEVSVECHEGDLADLGFATSASVDLVVSRGSVYFWDDLNAAFRETARVLRPGGMAFIGGGFGNAELRDRIVPAMAERKPGWEDFYHANMSRETTDRLRQASSGIDGVACQVHDDDSGVWVVMKRGEIP